MISDRDLLKYDPSRRIDVSRMNQKANDPTVPERDRKKAEEALYMMKHQRDMPSVQKLREQMRIATQNGDSAKVEKLSDEAKKIDRDFHF